MAVRVPSRVQKKFTLKELINYLIDNHEWIKKNELYEESLATLERFLPEVIKRNAKGDRIGIRTKLIIEILKGEISDPKYMKYLDNFPQFELDSLGKRTKIFQFDSLVDVAHLHDGLGFGELALINNSARAATV